MSGLCWWQIEAESSWDSGLNARSVFLVSFFVSLCVLRVSVTSVRVDADGRGCDGLSLSSPPYSSRVLH